VSITATYKYVAIPVAIKGVEMAAACSQTEGGLAVLQAGADDNIHQSSGIQAILKRVIVALWVSV
jgi:hypothetical protein